MNVNNDVNVLQETLKAVEKILQIALNPFFD